MKVRKGMKVIIRKPLNTHEWPVWTSQMDKFDGTMQTVSEVVRVEDRRGYFHIEESADWRQYQFHLDWAIPIAPLRADRELVTMLYEEAAYWG